MKRNLFAVLLIFCASNVYSQEEVSNEKREVKKVNSELQPKVIEPKKVETKSTSKNTSVTISKKPGQEQRVHDTEYYQEEIAKLDKKISDIEIKVAHVKSNPEEKELAMSNGWFEDITQILSQLEIKRNKLEEKLDLLKK